MELQDFVAETIKQVVKGVQGAQDETESTSAEINPYYPQPHGAGRSVQEVEFDIPVRPTEGFGIFVSTTGLDKDGKPETVAGPETRIRFSVPIKFPALEKH